MIRGRGKRGSNFRMPHESYPSKLAPSNFLAKDAARRSAFGGNVPAEDLEADFGHCTQCGLPQRLSDRATCGNCGSDNREGRSFYR
jgi:ribosomal protein S27AE